MFVRTCMCGKLYTIINAIPLCRRTIGYEDVLDALAQKGISIRVASPKLVMEEVKCLGIFLTAYDNTFA